MGLLFTCLSDTVGLKKLLSFSLERGEMKGGKIPRKIGKVPGSAGGGKAVRSGVAYFSTLREAWQASSMLLGRHTALS